MIKFFYYFLLYFAYCVLGYILECAFCSIISKKIVLNRGFLVGPYLPIYGAGAMLITLFLKKYLEDPIALFVMAALIATLLEYFTSYIMEKIFKARWWDYSEKKYNINGRVCLFNTLLFGIAGVLIMYFINPFFISILDKFSNISIIVIGIICLVIYLSDTFVSIITIYKLRINSNNINKDLTEEISEQVRKRLLKNRYFKKRMLNAFPRTEGIKRYKKLKELINKRK